MIFRHPARRQAGFTTVELMLVIAVLATVAFFAVPRFLNADTNAKKNTCDNNVDIINTQWEAKRLETGQYGNLNSLLNDDDYFPDGAPECPFGTNYSANNDERVTLHNH